MTSNFEKMYASLGKWGKNLSHSTLSLERVSSKPHDRLYSIRYTRLTEGLFIRVYLTYRGLDLNGTYAIIATNRETGVEKAARGVNTVVNEELRKGGIEKLIDSLVREVLGVARLDLKSLNLDNERHDLTAATTVLDNNVLDDRFFTLLLESTKSQTPKLKVWEANETGNIKRTLECAFVSTNTLGNINAKGSSKKIAFNLSEPKSLKTVFKALLS